MKMIVLSLVLAVCILPAVQGGRKCHHPEGNDGESFTEGCLKRTCKAEVWRTSLDAALCCYKGQPYRPNTTITTITTDKGCAKAVLSCKLEDDVATVVLQAEKKCGDYSTVEHVEELKRLVVQYIACDKE
eukprot:TRINITY_DN36359_c0_g1_i1.p1 TRINITY_DN36359_c0_g1~~TRINITY_DN36359_c0_g1_i1.p1  ORF type:complete len:130 (-),score=28.24 TRINITY_DN36359_c0_g1_i1:52-441(-)